MSIWSKYGGKALSEGKGLLDEAKRDVGHAVDEGADFTGDVLDTVGAHGAARKVRDGGDQLASYLGAHVDEQQLGPDAEPTGLIHGKPATIREKATHLAVFADAFAEVGVGMKAVDSAGWKGEAADTFREKFAVHPTKWLQAGAACSDAATALGSLADTVEWAQKQAEEAIRLYKKGKSASDAYKKQVDDYDRKAEGGTEDPGPLPPEQDPGGAALRAAQDVLDAARRQRNAVAAETEAKLTAALAHAPKEPSAVQQLKLDGADLLEAQYVDSTHVLGGVVKGTAGIVNFARSLDVMLEVCEGIVEAAAERPANDG